MKKKRIITIITLFTLLSYQSVTAQSTELQTGVSNPKSEVGTNNAKLQQDSGNLNAEVDTNNTELQKDKSEAKTLQDKIDNLTIIVNKLNELNKIITSLKNNLDMKPVQDSVSTIAPKLYKSLNTLLDKVNTFISEKKKNEPPKTLEDIVEKTNKIIDTLTQDKPDQSTNTDILKKINNNLNTIVEYLNSKKEVEPTENKVEPTENKVEPTENKVEPTENKVEPTENKVEPTENESDVFFKTMQEKLKDEIDNKFITLVHPEHSASFKIKFNNTILFGKAEVSLKETGKKTLKKIATLLKKIPEYELLIIGHADSQPISKTSILSQFYPTNWELSTKRAVMVTRYLIENYGIPGDKITAAGKSYFEDSGKKDSKHNRRTELWITPVSTKEK